MKIRDCVTELEDTKLYIQLLSLNVEYAELIKKFVQHIEPLMALIINYFPYYTRHDVHHGYQVVKRMEQCLFDSCFDTEQPESFTAQEIFLLIAAAYAHDLGMTVFPGEEYSLCESLGLTASDNWETSETLQNYLRKNHSARGGEYIEKNAEILGVPRNLIAALDLMMKAHNYSIPKFEEELNCPFVAGQKEIDLAQLAVIVCIADAIEYSDTRVVDGVIEQLRKKQSIPAKISYAENMKHICTGDSLAVSKDGRIIVSGTFSDENILSLAHRTFDQMEEWIQGYSDIENRYKVKRLKIRGGKFNRNLILSNGDFHRLGVRLNKRKVIDLIASNAVWRSDQGIALRELVQNSVEACRYREHHSAPADKYCPEIRIVFDRDSHSVSITDNGCGMSKRTVLNNLLTVGSSRACEVTYTEGDYDPIARFGIGFWSVFTISEIATISTSPFENCRGNPTKALCADGFEFNVQLADLKDYTVFRHIQKYCGTNISLKLKPEIFIDEVYTAFKHQLLCSMVPLTIIFDGNEEFIEKNVPDVDERKLFGVRLPKANSLGVKVFKYQDSTSQTSLSFGLAYRMKNDKATFNASSQYNGMYSVMEGHGLHTQRSAICGFSVPIRVTPLCIDLLRVGKYNANSLTPKGFEFSIDRRQLNSNTAEKKYKDDVRNLIHKGYRIFLKKTGSYDPKTIHRLQMEAASNGGNVYDVFTGSELNIAFQNYPDLICYKLIPVNSSLSLIDASKNAKFISLADLPSIDGIVYCLQSKRYSTGPMTYFHMDNPKSLEIAYAAVQEMLKITSSGLSIYLMLPNRNFSMLFDNDPLASVIVFPLPQIEICLLQINLSRINYMDEPINVVSGISGRWSGTVYWREFKTPDNKPYLFLGRYRVLIKLNSKLHLYLENLANEKRFAKIANTIHLLEEDKAGHKPDLLAKYL